jgi:hypothetical protein
MPTKTTKTGREYEVTGKKFHWFPLDDDDKPAEKPIIIPMRLKLGTVLEIGADQELTARTMRDMLESLIPGQMELLNEMDLNDFQAMFTTWQFEYELLSGATLGESAGSSKR